MSQSNSKLQEIIGQCDKIAVYGLSTETERFINEYGSSIAIVGLLDGFRDSGEMYGYPIIPISEAIRLGISHIVVVARPGSCKAITKRIGDICRENDIALFDVRGRNLLEEVKVAYGFEDLDGFTRADVMSEIEKAEVVSFDLFDTLITRKVMNYTDVFEIMARRLEEQGIYIPDFERLRLQAEKECSKGYAPVLTEIYSEVLRMCGGSFIDAGELADREWDIDRSVMLPRLAMRDIFRKCISMGKKVVVTTDTYYRKDQIACLLEEFGFDGYDALFVSCEERTAKTMKLFNALIRYHEGSSEGILHVGDDEFADVESPEKFGIRVCRVFSGTYLYERLGGLGIDPVISGLSDRFKAGLFISRIFNDPFVFEDGLLSVKNSSDVGFLFSAPMITDFVMWIRERVQYEEIPQFLFSARDGFLIGRLYRMIDKVTKSVYFLTSRTSAIRAGIETDDDIAYVDGMKYSGTEEECLKTRFGISKKDIEAVGSRSGAILSRSEKLRDNYKKYISKFGLGDGTAAMFDFVAKGTTQLYLRKLLRQHIKGFYFLQLEPEFMIDKGLDIEPFYTEDEKSESAIFDNYYILETILTSPYPSLDEFDGNGNPVFASETRSKGDIECVLQMQSGIEEYFREYTSLLPESCWKGNKKLDEAFLLLVNRLRISDEGFQKLTVEDPFFGRMTPVSDVIG